MQDQQQQGEIEIYVVHYNRDDYPKKYVVSVHKAKPLDETTLLQEKVCLSYSAVLWFIPKKGAKLRLPWTCDVKSIVEIWKDTVSPLTPS